MKLTEAIAIRVSQLLNEKNLSQYSLYKNGGVPRSTVCDVVNNKKKRVSTETIYQICTTLGLSLAEFFSDSIFNELDD
ncbi:MAG: helix-turn-helix domain-containing protein [Christensenellales bacterium]